MQARNERPLELGYDEPGGQPTSERIELNEEAEAVLAALSRLPITQRKVAALRYDEFEINEIGEMLGMTDAAVRQNLSRARRRLRDQLESRRPALGGRQAA
jgi:RNA polymerase sigma-70 factor (ECF subfamily)